MQLLQTSVLPSQTSSSQFPHSLSSTHAIAQLSLLPKLSSLSLTHPTPPPSLFIRCGGGPRTYPGGVSKWQWKRMQSKKAKQLLKARLSRERSIYEMRKRAELKAAVSDLERPWEIIPNNNNNNNALSSSPSSSLFSVSADEQLKVLADRFQKPGGFDLWSHNDGPQLFNTHEDLPPSSRFFPKGVVHSVKPYGKIGADQPKIGPNRRKLADKSSNYVKKDGNRARVSGNTNSSQMKDRNRKGKEVADSRGFEGNRGNDSNGGDESGRKVGRSDKNTRYKYSNRGQNSGRMRGFNGEDVYDMSLQGDGRYGLSGRKHDHESS